MIKGRGIERALTKVRERNKRVWNRWERARRRKE